VIVQYDQPPPLLLLQPVSSIYGKVNYFEDNDGHYSPPIINFIE
jgi:hypothetical protein